MHKNKIIPKIIWTRMLKVYYRILSFVLSKSKCNISTTDLYLLNNIFWGEILSKKSIASQLKKKKKKNHDDGLKGIWLFVFHYIYFIHHKFKNPILKYMIFNIIYRGINRWQVCFTFLLPVFSLSLSGCLSFWNEWIKNIFVHIQTIIRA